MSDLCVALEDQCVLPLYRLCDCFDSQVQTGGNDPDFVYSPSAMLNPLEFVLSAKKEGE